jgi:hypothetical protein
MMKLTEHNPKEFLIQNKADICDWLNQHHITHFFIEENLIVHVEDNVYLTDVEQIPFQFGRVKGNFNATMGKLRSLKGTPLAVLAQFDVSYNPITSLDYAPLFVGAEFLAHHCEIKDITNLNQSQILGLINLCNNQISSLEGSPQHVNGAFFIGHNPLISLVGGPKRVALYSCEDCQITHLDGLALEITELNIKNNPITDYTKLLDYSHLLCYEGANILDNNIHSIKITGSGITKYWEKIIPLLEAKKLNAQIAHHSKKTHQIKI